MTNVARLNDLERTELAKYAYNLCINNFIDWVTGLEIAQDNLFPEEKRYAKATLKYMSNTFVKLLKKEKIDFDPIEHSNKIIERQQLNFHTNKLKHNPIFFNNSGVRFGVPMQAFFGIPNPSDISNIAGIPNPGFHGSLNSQSMFSGNRMPNEQEFNRHNRPPNWVMQDFNQFKQYNKTINDTFNFQNKISELASIYGKQFEDILSAELDKALNKALSSVERSFEQKLNDARKTAGVAKKYLPKVMVIGVMGEVAYETNNEYGEVLDLRFYKIEENLNLIRSQAKNCDYVILITKHINHGHQDCVRDHPGLIFCNGGVTQMKEILLTLACK